jgi:AbrB family looped-hinge helix DNA binding protein
MRCTAKGDIKAIKSQPVRNDVVDSNAKVARNLGSTSIMKATLSSRGRVVLPKSARLRLRLRAGAKFMCKVEGGSIVLTPERRATRPPRLVRDRRSGLIISKSPPGVKVTNEDVRAALLDFP